MVNKNLRFGGKSLRIDGKKLRIQSVIRDSDFNVMSKNNLDQIAMEFMDGLFGAKEIIQLLNCVPNTATNYIKKLLELDLIEKV